MAACRRYHQMRRGDPHRSEGPRIPSANSSGSGLHAANQRACLCRAWAAGAGVRRGAKRRDFRNQCLPGWNQRLLVFRAARRFPSRRTGAVGRPDRIGASPEGDASRSRSLPLPGGPFLVTIRLEPQGELPLLRPSGRDGVPTALWDGSLPRLPRILRPDSPREVLTKVLTSPVPSACLRSHNGEPRRAGRV